MKRFRISNWKSRAMWPADAGISLGNEQNISEDTHDTEGQARSVCKGLKQEGFGGEGKVFPVAVWYEPVIVEMPSCKSNSCPKKY